MPIDYKKYHPEWKTRIRPDILKRANNCCEECGVKNYSLGFWDKSGSFWLQEAIWNHFYYEGYDVFENELSHMPPNKNPVKVVLTISHTDHDITNNDYSNLKALCQLHHNRHDAAYRAANRNKKP